jgi:hypothetical protein
VNTILNLESAPFTVTSNGTSPVPYAIPFTISGQIQAAVPPVSANIPPALLINDEVSGSGTVYFPLSPSGNATYSLNAAVNWVFAPEPTSALLVPGAALFALCAGWFLRRSRTHRKR